MSLSLFVSRLLILLIIIYYERTDHSRGTHIQYNKFKPPFLPADEFSTSTIGAAGSSLHPFQTQSLSTAHSQQDGQVSQLQKMFVRTPRTGRSITVARCRNAGEKSNLHFTLCCQFFVANSLLPILCCQFFVACHRPECSPVITRIFL